MTINLMYNKSEQNQVTKELTTLITLTGTMREESSILRPSILLQKAKPEIIYQVNYMYIPDFHRYYFVTNIIQVRNNLWRIEGRVDVLQTYAFGIRAQTALIERQESLDMQNSDITDSEVITNADSIIDTQVFPNRIEFGNWSYLLLTIGDGGDASEQPTEPTTPTAETTEQQSPSELQETVTPQLSEEPHN